MTMHSMALSQKMTMRKKTTLRAVYGSGQAVSCGPVHRRREVKSMQHFLDEEAKGSLR
jgi:hypothetical protein